jgi:phosphinothricin acetyltransferase
VAEENGIVVGYAGSFLFRTRCAYEGTIETPVYCAPEAVGRGIGSALYRALFESLTGEDVHAAIAALGLPNEASVSLHERLGFQLVGVMHEVGRKFDRWWDVGWYEKRLG